VQESPPARQLHREESRASNRKILGNIKRRPFEAKRIPPWETDSGCTLHSTLVVECKRTEDAEKRKDATKRTIEARGQHQYTIYTDGSAEEGVKNGGSASVITREGEVIHTIKRPAGWWCSSYTAELTALEAAADWIAENEVQDALILTDSQAAIKALHNLNKTSDGLLAKLHSKLKTCCRRSAITLQWIPGHCGTDGNEIADQEANNARAIQQNEVPIEWRAARARLRRETRKKWTLENRHAEVYGEGIKREEERPRREEVLGAQLRAGHVTSSAYYRKRFNIEQDGTCHRCGEEEEKDHIWECPADDATRLSMGIPVTASPKIASKEENLAIRYARKVRPNWF